MNLREELMRYIQKKYKVKPGYTRRGGSDTLVYRHESNGEYFAVFMKIRSSLVQPDAGRHTEERLEFFGRGNMEGILTSADQMNAKEWENMSAGRISAEEWEGTPSGRIYVDDRDVVSSPESEELIDAVSVKLDNPMIVDAMIQQPGYCRAYRVLQGCWLTAALDGTVPADEIRGLIDGSFIDTATPAERKKYRPPKEWLVPANPKYFDIVHAFDDRKIINWKQGAGIKAGDTVYMYVAAPVSAILYKCRVTETDIPYEHPGHRLNITALMKIRLQKRYRPTQFTFEKLNKDYEIFAVRGPRGIPRALSEALKK